MGIFLGDTAPSKIFVGGDEVSSVRVWDTQVRPTQASQHYVFDFTTSVADWTLGSRLSFVSWTWIVRRTSWSGWNQYAYYNNTLDIDRPNVKRLTYKSNTWWNTGSWNGSITQWIISGQEASTRPTSISWTLWITSQFTTSGGRTGSAGYLNRGLVSRSPASTQNAEMLLDFENKQVTVTYNWTIVVNQATISDADIQTIRSQNHQYVEMWLDAQYNKYVSLIDILVEY